jgi:hypothetical protein
MAPSCWTSLPKANTLSRRFQWLDRTTNQWFDGYVESASKDTAGVLLLWYQADLVTGVGAPGAIPIIRPDTITANAHD